MNNPTPTTDASMAEKEQVLRNDARVRSGSTYLSHTHNDEGGRFAKPRTVIGSEATAQYPMAAPNWSVDPVPPEPPLGFDVNSVEPCGEYGEIQASLNAQGDPAKPEDNSSHFPASGDVGSSPTPDLAGANSSSQCSDPLHTGDAEAPLAAVASPADVEPPANPIRKRRSL